jgi:carboxypeptidase C (cathepsin A)
MMPRAVSLPAAFLAFLLLGGAIPAEARADAPTPTKPAAPAPAKPAARGPTSASAAAAGRGRTAERSPAEPGRVETAHSITLAGRRIAFRAIAETLPLRNPEGAETASVFTISYLAKSPPEKTRPVSFVFDGGPGASSVFLQLGALGPRILSTPESGAVPSPPYRLVDNPWSWLAFSDLVFVDPVGTGFSRGKGKGGNLEKPFFGVRADLRSLDTVIRLWLTRYRRWDSPVYLVGESYGGFRVAALSQSLARHVGVTASGIVMVSPALDLSLLHRRAADLIAPASELPSYAACAAALDGKTRDQSAVERFALSDYLLGLARLKGVPPPGDPFIARIARMIGISPEVVRRHRGRVPPRAFAASILRAKGEKVSLYDGTVARAAPAGAGSADPVLDPAIAAYTAAFNVYAANTLGYRTDLSYRALAREATREWNWQGAEAGAGGLGLALSSLEAMLLQHPQTKVLIVHGRYDLVTPYLASRWLVDQMAVPAAVRAGIVLKVYAGGHMMYMRPSARAALARDARSLYRASPSPLPRQAGGEGK